MITIKPQDPAKAGDIHELEVGWDQDADENESPEWWITINSNQHRPTIGLEQFYLPEHPDMLAAVVRSILDPERFKTYNPRTRVALIQAAMPWMRRCGLLPQPQMDPLEDWQ